MRFLQQIFYAAPKEPGNIFTITFIYKHDAPAEQINVTTYSLQLKPQYWFAAQECDATMSHKEQMSVPKNILTIDKKTRSGK